MSEAQQGGTRSPSALEQAEGGTRSPSALESPSERPIHLSEQSPSERLIHQEDLRVESLVVIIGCSDQKLRAVKFEGKMAKQVHGYVRHIQGGKLQLITEPLVLMEEREADRIVALAERMSQESKKSGRLIRFLRSCFPERSREVACSK